MAGRLVIVRSGITGEFGATALLLSFWCLLFGVGTVRAQGNTYYVSLDGNDAGEGLSKASAWRTITRACIRLRAGDTLIVRPGDYGCEHAVLIHSGTPDARIVIKAEVPGQAVMNGAGLAPGIMEGALVGEHALFTPKDKKGDGTGTGLMLLNKSNVTVEGIRFTNYSSGLCVRYRSTNITIRKCVFVENNNFGLLLYGWKTDPSKSYGHLFTENEFYDYTDKQDYGIALYFSTHVRASNNYFFGWHHQALSFKKLMFDSVASDNTFEGFRYTGIYLGQNEDGGGEGILRCENLIAERNVFRPAIKFRAKRSVMIANVTRGVVRDNYTEGKTDVDGGWGEGVGVSGSAKHAKIYRNVIVSMGGTTSNPGIRMNAAAVGTKVFHNTIVDCAHGLGFEAHASVLFKNNIFFRNGRMIRSSDKADARNCVFEKNNIHPGWKGGGRANISSDPRFVGALGPLVLGPQKAKFIPDFSRSEAFRLRACSPCLDAGTHLTRAEGPGKGKRIKVKDAEYFINGFGMGEGDLVRIGGGPPVKVVSVDYDSGMLTLKRSQSWKAGAGVSFVYSGSAPDLGARTSIATLRKVLGRIAVKRKARRWARIRPGSSLLSGDALKTYSRGKAVVVLSDGSTIALNAATEVIIGYGGRTPKTGYLWTIRLLKGEIFVRLRGKREEAGFRVSTAHATVAAKSGEFSVRLSGGNTTVAVMDGEVECSNPKGKVLLGKGFLLKAERGRKPSDSETLPKKEPERIEDWTGKLLD